MVLKVVTKIENLISEVAELQKGYVKETCSQCASCCCSRVHYLFNEKDIFFLRLSGRKTRWRRGLMEKKGCWFLGPHGCILDPPSRPFICHRYICSALEEEMVTKEPGLPKYLREKFKVIDEMRSQMWAEFLENSKGHIDE